MGHLLSTPGGVLRAQHRKASAAAAEEDVGGDIWIVAGLGNPGPRYAGNRHNVGFMAVDALAQREGVKLTKLQHNAAVARVNIDGQRVLLAKPMTFMNESGKSVGRLAQFYKVPPCRVLIIYDDMDIAPAAVRLRAKGGHGGHNGMRSLCAHLGGNNFPRIRIGVGRPVGSQSVIQHVLADFTKQEQQDIEVAIQETIAILRAVFSLGIERSLSGMRV